MSQLDSPVPTLASLEALQERHAERRGCTCSECNTKPGMCFTCKVNFPCDTAQALTLARKLEEECDELQGAWTTADSERQELIRLNATLEARLRESDARNEQVEQLLEQSITREDELRARLRASEAANAGLREKLAKVERYLCDMDTAAYGEYDETLIDRMQAVIFVRSLELLADKALTDPPSPGGEAIRSEAAVLEDMARWFDNDDQPEAARHIRIRIAALATGER